MRPGWLFTPKYPLIPWYTLKNRSILAMFVVNMFDFMSYAILSIYYSSYMQVAARVSPSKATMIDNTIRIVFQVVAIIMGVTMRFWTPLCKKLGFGERLFRTRWPIWIGIPICTLSMGLSQFRITSNRDHTNTSHRLCSKPTTIERYRLFCCWQILVWCRTRSEWSFLTPLHRLKLDVPNFIPSRYPSCGETG